MNPHNQRQAMLTYPQFDPVALAIGPISIHWYGIMYMIAFGGAWGLASYRAKQRPGMWTPEQISDLVFYGALGAVLGGRMGSVLFYNFDRFLSDPAWLLRVWEGGMSFHGGLLGVLLAFFLYSRSIKKEFFEVMDFIAPLVPFPSCHLVLAPVVSAISSAVSCGADPPTLLGVWFFPT